MVETNPEWYHETLCLLFELVAEKKIQVVIAKRLPLTETAQGHTLLESGAISGKIVLDV